jgi:Tfp pilus assembly ATPase PilU
MRIGHQGMRTFDQDPARLTRKRAILQEEAEIHARGVFAHRRFLKGVQFSGDHEGIAEQA